MREIMSFSGEIYNGSKKFTPPFVVTNITSLLKRPNWWWCDDYRNKGQNQGSILFLLKYHLKKEQYSMNMKWVVKIIILAKVVIIETDLFQSSLKGQIWIDCSWSIIWRIKISSYLCVIFRLKHLIICDISPASHFHCHVTFTNVLIKAMPTFLEGSRPRRRLMFDG